MRPFVVYWNNIPAPYVVDRFNALADRGRIEFQAWFNDRTHSDRSWEVDELTWRFNYRYLPTVRFRGMSFHLPLPVLGRRPDLIFSGYSEPVWVIGWFIARLRRIRTGFRVLRTFDTWVKRNWFKDHIKHYMFRHVDAIETPGQDGKNYAVKHGALPARVHVATHTVDLDRVQSCKAVAHIEREQLRARLGLVGATFVYVGRLVQDKGIDFLITAFARVQRQCVNAVSLLLVGDGAEVAILRRQCEQSGIRNVVFTGFIQKNELVRYYVVADVFVFPTLGDPYGIVVDEAMACGLPVVSSVAAGEIRSRVEEGVNGFLVPVGDSASLAERMLRLANDFQLCERMGKASMEKVKDHTPQKWAADFERIVSSVLFAP